MERRITQVDFPAPMDIPKLLRVMAYARVSSGKDAMLHSLSSQVSHYSAYIQQHPGWVYCGVCADEAFTGTKDSREGFQKMLTACRNGEVDMVITKSISRFARNTVTLLETVRELKELGVDVYFEEQNIHTMSAEGELMMTILASYAQEESRSASENQKWRIRKSFERGEVMCLRFLYGYDITKDGITVNPEQAEVVREIFHRANTGESFNSIARDLNDRGITCTLGGKWCSMRIREVLGNEKYMGHSLLQKKFRNNHLEKKEIHNNGELPKYFVENTHEAIIDEATFGAAQRALAEVAKVTGKRGRPTKTAFTSFIRCEKCGLKYKRVTFKGGKAWCCSTFQTKGKEYCTEPKLPEDTLIALTREVLGVESVTVELLHERLTEIRARNFTLTFCFKDGTEVCRRWQHRSRAESWTDEMKEQARQRALAQRRNTE